MKSILLVKKLLGLVKMMPGLVNASFSLPKWQAATLQVATILDAMVPRIMKLVT